MPSISAIFFDLDGTLVDSSIGIHNAFTHTFKELGVPSPRSPTLPPNNGIASRAFAKLPSLHHYNKEYSYCS